MKCPRCQQENPSQAKFCLATGEILRVIASSPAGVLPVFEAITDSAMRLFSAWSVPKAGRRSPAPFTFTIPVRRGE